ncbi:peptidoglycan DD-metalloendopeptidase family protein [Flavobacteriaceae bacterium]|jgi:septal ring factor EnvC (AmiA/AmiB activator)|nr:peptidoglycan DD-metalloendopeptidase family protein [Flavobacteriaceae bacterium]MDA9028743.1 peptidoglycan DD-metalloendopeptidase family protein [Flavobacteriaceae bacterium]MDC1195142.1 peptidoglycan DD-metalloendopeptidase family protein [Flavobacteriaceae bacterium]MDG1384638.1 peptidoglycan DD-metalloendopeptidase family protein [Flavobacteriaceae bacterium]
MKLSNTRFTFTAFLLILMLHFSGFSQSKKQQELEERRRELRQEIQQIGVLLFEGKKEQKSVLSVVEDLDFKIKVRKNLIKITNQQANLLTREISSNQTKISKLRDKLKVLKADYAEMIVKSYKSRSDQNKLMFLLSSTNFQQAYKRLQYIKQYADYQMQQAELIKTETAKMQALNIELLAQKKNKQILIEENKKAKSILDKDREQQSVLIQEIKSNLSQFTVQLKSKQTESKKIDKEIRKIIQAAIAASNKKAGKSSKLKVFSLTPEQKILAANFTANKGKLPWPVVNGVVKLRYGNNPSPIDPSLTIKSNGVRIATSKGGQVRAVFEGVVQGIMTPKNGNNTIMIRHGNYITVYKNLSKFYVSKGDKVTTKQVIGEVITNKASGESILSFGIYKDSSTQNPSQWIYRL